MRAQAPRGVASGEVLEREWWGVVGQGPSALGEWKYRRVAILQLGLMVEVRWGSRLVNDGLLLSRFGLDDVNVVNGSSCNGVELGVRVCEQQREGDERACLQRLEGDERACLQRLEGDERVCEQQREGGERFYEQQHARGDGQACVQQRVRGGERVGGGRDGDDEEGVPRRCDGSKCVDHHPEKVRDQQAD
eukprot:CAMPEP_0185622230 /NCGR_PEP_ID=MMETSP0436-20130131/59096_1 /TAXON_ID=626734 ORGANISM="Favella taraikaensis, Strain Fe Narragansett Bay" /NCGR_SAMPLE_ID=MMETSP0436 /ASSEMBLY_ACC=CAM_ASM_000390 /LENGTH=190 /DNA_ID=CAMNT_0028263913 /DNA_START=274 /DNA_END=846 /DNA_ORIENTATION=+